MELIQGILSYLMILVLIGVSTGVVAKIAMFVYLMGI